jgi:uncharacterized membrane protein
VESRIADIEPWETEARPPGVLVALRPAPAVSWTARIVVGCAAAAYLAWFGWHTVQNHRGLWTFGFDLGIYDQGLWLLSRFREPFVTVMGRNLFGDHTSFLLLPLVPLYWVCSSGAVLLTAQAAALASAAVPVFLLGRELLRSERQAAVAAVAFLLHPALMWTNLENFHPDTFEVPLLLFALLFMVKRRWAPYLAMVGLLLLVKEDVALLTGALGIYVAFRGSRRVGAVTTAVSAAWFAVAVFVVLRHFNGVGTLNGWRVPFGGIGGLLSTAFTDPGTLLSYLGSGDRLWYVLQLLAPFALLPLLAPEVVAIAALPLAGNVLSTFWYQQHIEYHYDTLILPVLMFATLLALGRIRQPRRRVAGVALLLAAALGAAFWWGPLPGTRQAAHFAATDTAQVAAMDEVAKLIPPEAVVSSYYRFITPLLHRTEIYEFPNPFRTVNWGVHDRDGLPATRVDAVEYLVLPAEEDLSAQYRAVFDRIRDGFEIVYRRAGIVVLRAVPS